MKNFMIHPIFYLFIVSMLSTVTISRGQQIEQFEFESTWGSPDPTTENAFQFNGYTNHWHNDYKNWYRYANLFKMSTPDIELTYLQSKVDIAEEIGIPGLILQEGFMNELLSDPHSTLNQPSVEEVENAIEDSNVLVLTSPESSVGKVLMEQIQASPQWNSMLKSTQFGSVDFVETHAFYLSKGDRKIFVIASSPEQTEKLLSHINNAINVIANYDLHKGLFGVKSLLKSVTCEAGHPLEVIGKGMNEGNSWFIFDGYMDFLMKDELTKWIDDVKLSIVANVGFSPIYGCDNYNGLQVQDMIKKEAWIKYAHQRGGYAFRPVYDADNDPALYDGYIAAEGNKAQIDNENIPFIHSTNYLSQDLLPSMVLFMDKGKELSHDHIWETILNKQNVAVLERGKMLGAAKFRNALQMLLLDRIYLEEYFGDRIDIAATTEGYELHIELTNRYPESVSGKLEIAVPSAIKVEGNLPLSVALPANSTKHIKLMLQPGKEAMNYTNPVAVHFKWKQKKKSTLAILDLPPAISVHKLLYAHAPEVIFPVTVHNFTDQNSFPVKVEVFQEGGSKKRAVYDQTNECKTPSGSFKEMVFNLTLDPGSYTVEVTALGTKNASQLGVGKPEGKPYVYEVDLNSDGINEYRMENDSVQITLLTTGARVIEYIVKSRDDNVLFKLWPDKPINDKRPFRKRGYYPYGGFEDFLGQASMETHEIYDAKIVNKEGDFVRVEMVADYYGNEIKKTFTLYGNSPLLEVRFALTFKNREANVLGPQPILELGKSHGTEDVFTAPTLDGPEEYRMEPERYFGRLINLKEGWNAGYDTKEDITFVGAFPVSQPLFLHLWMNHPMNGDARHYYVEFQPWTPIIQKSTMYFTYYIWGSGGPWQSGVDELRKRNLVSVR